MRRKLGLILVFGAALPLAVASAAWACGVLTTLSLDQKVAAPGSTLTATGRNWSTNATASVVTLRLQSRSGTTLTTVTPTSDRRISKGFTLPASLSPGWYVVLATQFNANGSPVAGTPGRTTVRVQGAAAASQVAGAPWSGSQPQGPAASAATSGGSGLIALLLAGVLSLTMLASGWKLLGRRGRTVATPQFGV